MNYFTLTILLVSIIVQLTAAVLALRLNRKINGVDRAWLLIVAALSLMAIRRIITFIGFFAPQVEDTVKGSIAETVALLIALLMVLGVSFIPRIFQSLQQTTEALRVSEARYRTLIDSADDLIFSLGRDGRYTAVNTTLLRRFGLNEENFVGKTIHDIYQSDEADFYEKQNTHVFQTGHPLHFERHSITPRGKLWFSLSLSPIFDAEDQVIAISGIARDVTEQKQAEQALYESEERFRTLVEGAIAGVLVTHETKPVFVNASYARILGYESPAELLGTGSVVPLIAPYDQPRLLGYLAARLRGEYAPNRYEYDAVRKDGSIVTLQQLVTVITWDGEPAVLTTAVDITEHKQAEALLRESEQRYRGVVEDTHVLICCFLPGGEITFVNKAYCDYFDQTSDQLVGSNFMTLIPQTDQEAVMANITALTVDYPAQSHKHQVIAPDGTIRWQRWTNRALFDAEGKVISYQAIGEDITEHKQAEEEHLKLKKLESLGLLAGGIAHDFNNLLTGLFGSVEVAKVFLPADHKSHKYLESATRSMERATHLTQQLLTFAKGGNPIKETLSISEVITETAQFSLRGSNVKLETPLSPDLWLIEADKGQLSQVISNLVINAQQAMPTGGTITITAKNVITAEGNSIQITVQDEGVGIAPQHLDKVFDPYFSTKQGGSGLGLTSTHSVITKHNGRIHVSSRLNQGTTFTIHLPAAKETATLLQPEPTDESETIPARHTRILILDDEEVVRTVLEAMLQEIGCHVSYAADGQAAITKYQTAFANGGGYDLVITDLTIPGGMGGQVAAQEILKINPQAKIVVSSGYATDPVMANFEEYGFRAVIAKPYRLTELRKVIQRVLGPV